MLHCLEEHRPGKWKIRTKLFVVILIMLAVSILLFWGLWNLQESVCHVFENLHLISWFDEDTYIEQIKEDAVNYNVPELESDKTAQKAFRPFLKKHTSYYIGCYIYGHDDGLFRAGHAAKVIEKIMYGSINQTAWTFWESTLTLCRCNLPTVPMMSSIPPLCGRGLSILM